MTDTTLRKSLTAPENAVDLAQHIIEFDPRRPAGYVFAATPLSAEAVDLAKPLAPDPIPWPAGLAPKPVRHRVAPAEDDPLPRADVLVVTYTVSEGYAAADILTPGLDTTQWTEYRNGWPALRALITGSRAPALHYQRSGLWALTKIGKTRAVVFKSDLHPATDGSRLPIVALWRQLIEQVRPSLVITTGTAGGVGADTVLGDVVVARHVRWDCTKQFSHKPFAHSEYVGGATVDPAEFTLVEQTLMPVNAKKLPPGNRPPRVWLDSDATPAGALTTDFFAFDDAADHYGLRTVDPTARAVEMDDAALGLALADAASPPEWLSVRNASDPQMDGPDLATETAQAAAIYEKYGQITSWGSALVCWALIANRAAKSLHGARLQRTLVIPTQEAPWPHR